MTDIAADPDDLDEVPDDEPEIEVTVPSPAEPSTAAGDPAI